MGGSTKYDPDTSIKAGVTTENINAPAAPEAEQTPEEKKDSE